MVSDTRLFTASLLQPDMFEELLVPEFLNLSIPLLIARDSASSSLGRRVLLCQDGELLFLVFQEVQVRLLRDLRHGCPREGLHWLLRLLEGLQKLLVKTVVFMWWFYCCRGLLMGTTYFVAQDRCQKLLLVSRQCVRNFYQLHQLVIAKVYTTLWIVLIKHYIHNPLISLLDRVKYAWWWCRGHEPVRFFGRWL